jgi:hypothetical protein
VAFFYYSGHGAADRTDRGENYLIPVGAKITLARQLPILGVSLTEITKSLERVPAKARFVVVDACRNVAFTKGIKDAHKGFVAERRLDGIIVAFATRPGETAEDNNIYAGALASVLPTPGLTAEQVFKETQLKVADLSRGQQIPWIEDELLTRFRFKEALAAEVQPPLPAPLPAVRVGLPIHTLRQSGKVNFARRDENCHSKLRRDQVLGRPDRAAHFHIESKRVVSFRTVLRRCNDFRWQLGSLGQSLGDGKRAAGSVTRGTLGKGVSCRCLPRWRYHRQRGLWRLRNS